jgi:hypothetical protein
MVKDKKSKLVNVKVSPKIVVFIPLTWDIVEEIRVKVRRKLKGISSFIIEAAEMTSSELAENAIKYGIANDKSNDISFSFTYEPAEKLISIEVTNGIRDMKEVKKTLVKTIEKIKASPDKSVLYIRRLKELMEKPQPGVSKLGLFRIAFEGEFELDCKLEKNVVTVYATRKF